MKVWVILVSSWDFYQVLYYSVEHHQLPICSLSLEVSPPKFFDYFCDRDVVANFSGPVTVTAVGHSSGGPVLDHL